MFVTWIAISLVVAIGLCVILNCLEQIMLIDIEKMNLKKKAKKEIAYIDYLDFMGYDNTEENRNRFKKLYLEILEG